LIRSDSPRLDGGRFFHKRFILKDLHKLDKKRSLGPVGWIGLTGNPGNRREKAQEAQEPDSSFATFCASSRPYPAFDFEAFIFMSLSHFKVGCCCRGAIIGAARHHSPNRTVHPPFQPSLPNTIECSHFAILPSRAVFVQLPGSGFFNQRNPHKHWPKRLSNLLMSSMFS
jgi:hypothetical protein